MIVGFTGTKAGMTLKQQGELMFWLGRLADTHSLPVSVSGTSCARLFKHGMCVGADAQAHKLAKVWYSIVGYPSTRVDKRAPLPVADFVKIHEPMDPIERNELIADADVLIVAPRQRKEIIRSGTWTTFRRARDAGRACLVLWP